MAKRVWKLPLFPLRFPLLLRTTSSTWRSPFSFTFVRKQSFSSFIWFWHSIVEALAFRCLCDWVEFLVFGEEVGRLFWLRRWPLGWCIFFFLLFRCLSIKNILIPINSNFTILINIYSITDILINARFLIFGDSLFLVNEFIFRFAWLLWDSTVCCSFEFLLWNSLFILSLFTAALNIRTLVDWHDRSWSFDNRFIMILKWNNLIFRLWELPILVKCRHYQGD